MTTSSVMFILDFVLLFLCLERVMCTLKVSNYEESSCPKVVTSLLMIATSFWGLVYYLFMSPGVDFRSAIVQTSTRTKENAASGPIIIYMLVACESASVVLFLYIRKWNLRLGRNLHANRTGGHSQKFLSTKFQIGETLRVTEVFLPILIIKWTLTVFGAAAIYCLRVIPAIVASSPSTQATLFEAVNVNYLQGLTTPLFLMYRCDQLGSFLRGSQVKPVETVIATHGRNDFEDYFRRLENVFNA
ncbi:hypothetical protein AAVH_11566 [Aphelenchoides avenae]|nr:hypothetical protein AAVH_11566 [Aphelenchus avenae]